MTPQKSNMRKVLGLRLLILLAISALLSYSLRQQWNTVNTNARDVLEKRDMVSRDDFSHATEGRDGSFDVEPASNENDDVNDYNDNDVAVGGDDNDNLFNDDNDVHKDNFDDRDGDKKDEANVGTFEGPLDRNDEAVVEVQRSDDDNDSSYVYDETDDNMHSNPEFNLPKNGAMKEEGFDMRKFSDAGNVFSEAGDNEETDIGKDNRDDDGVKMTPNDKTLDSFDLNTNDDRDDKSEGSIDPWTVLNAQEGVKEYFDNNGFEKKIDVKNAEGQFRDMNGDYGEIPNEQSSVSGSRFGSSDIKTKESGLFIERGQGELAARVSVTEKKETEEDEKKGESGESVHRGIETEKFLIGNDKNSDREDGDATRIGAFLSDQPVGKGYAMASGFEKLVLVDGDQVQNVDRNNQIRKVEAILKSVDGTDSWSKYRNRVLDYLFLGRFDKGKINPRPIDNDIDTGTINSVSNHKNPEGIRDYQVPIMKFSPVIDSTDKRTNTFDLIDWALLSHGQNNSDVNGNDTDALIDGENEGENNVFENRVDDKATLVEKVHNTMDSPGERIHDEVDTNTLINPEVIQGIITNGAQEHVLLNSNIMPNMNDKVKAAWTESNIRDQGIDSSVDAFNYGSLSSIKQVKDDGDLGVNIDRNYIPRQYPPIQDNSKLNGRSLFESPGFQDFGGLNIQQGNSNNNAVAEGHINKQDNTNVDHTFNGGQINMNSLLGVVAKTQNIPDKAKLETQVKSAQVLTEQEDRRLSSEFGTIKTNRNGEQARGSEPKPVAIQIKGDSYIGARNNDGGYIPNKNLNDYPIVRAPGFDEFRGFDIKYTDGDKKIATGIENGQVEGFESLPISNQFQKYESSLTERNPDKPKLNSDTMDVAKIDGIDNNNDQVVGGDEQESIEQTVATPGNPETNNAVNEQQTVERSSELMAQQQNGNAEQSLIFKEEANFTHADNEIRKTVIGKPETDVSGDPDMRSPGFFSRSLLSFFLDGFDGFNEDRVKADDTEDGGDGLDAGGDERGARETYPYNKISTGQELDNEQREEDSQRQPPNVNAGYEEGDNYEGGGDGVDPDGDDEEERETYPYRKVSPGQEIENEHREEYQNPKVAENAKSQGDNTGMSDRFIIANDAYDNSNNYNHYKNNIVQPIPKQTTTPNNNGGSYDNPRPLTQEEYNALHTLPYRKKPMTTERFPQDGGGQGGNGNDVVRQNENENTFIEKNENFKELNQNHNPTTQPYVNNNYFQDTNNPQNEPFQDLKNDPNAFGSEDDERKMMELLMNEEALKRGENIMALNVNNIKGIEDRPLMLQGDKQEFGNYHHYFNDLRKESDISDIFLDQEGERDVTLPRLSNCPISLELSPVSHAVTALVVFPGALADWLKNAIEQITGEPSDSLYNVIASLKEEDTSPFFQMPKRSVIQTHSAQSRDFDKAILIINNPLAVEKKHLQFLPFAFEWRRYFLWGDTMISWLSSDVTLLVMTADDLIADPETQLRKIASFLNVDDAIVDTSLTCALLQKPPILIDDITKISGVYSGDRRRMSRSIDEVIEIASRKAPDILHRLFQYKTLLYI